MRILIVSEDETVTREAHAALVAAGFAARVAPPARTPDDTAAVVRAATPELLVLDETAAGEAMIRLCNLLRETPTLGGLGIVVVAVDANRSRVVDALDAGADDCLTRPLEMAELLARVRALLRRRTAPTRGGRLVAGPIDMDLDSWTVRIDGAPASLTKKEFELLHILLQARGRVLDRATLLASVWTHGTAPDLDTRTVDVHVGRLRRKLGPAGRHVLTVRNVGFRFAIVPEWIAGRH